MQVSKLSAASLCLKPLLCLKCHSDYAFKTKVFLLFILVIGLCKYKISTLEEDKKNGSVRMSFLILQLILRLLLFEQTSLQLRVTATDLHCFTQLFL